MYIHMYICTFIHLHMQHPVAHARPLSKKGARACSSIRGPAAKSRNWALTLD